MNASTWRSAAKASLPLILVIPLLALAQSDQAKQTRSAFIHKAHPLRVMDGRLYDFSVFFAELNKSNAVPFGFEDYLIVGKVLQVTQEGVIVTRYETVGDTKDLDKTSTVFVENWHDQDSALDDAPIYTLAILTGRYQYVAVTGAGKTIPKYDCGHYFDPTKDHFETKTVIRQFRKEEMPVTDWDRL